MMSPFQVANELETFKSQHGNGQIITDAVATIRSQEGIIREYREMEAQFGVLLRFAKKFLGRDLRCVAKRKAIRYENGAESIGYDMPTPSERNYYNGVVRDSEKFIANAGVYGDVSRVRRISRVRK